MNKEGTIRHHIEAVSGTIDLSLSHECVEDLVDLIKKTSIVQERTRSLNLTNVPPSFLFSPKVG